MQRGMPSVNGNRKPHICGNRNLHTSGEDVSGGADILPVTPDGKLRSRRSRGDSLTLFVRCCPQPVLMLTHPVAVAPDVDDVAMVQQPVQLRWKYNASSVQ